MTSWPRTRIDTATARKLAVAASADPRTVLREFRQPGSVRGMAGHRVRRVLAAEFGAGYGPGKRDG